MAKGKYGVDRYANTPRKIFDKYVDTIALRRQRDRQDHRADMQALIKRLNNLEQQLTEALLMLDEHEQHLETHCLIIDKDARKEDMRDS